MMRLYYTTSVKENDPQKDIRLSLGGYMSTVAVKKSSLNNFFSNVTEYSKANIDKKQYIALILKNDDVQDVSNVNIWFDFPENCASVIKIAAISLTDGATERVSDTYTEPLFIDEFHEANGKDGSYSVGGMEKNEGVAIWLERTFIESKILNQKLYEPVDNYSFKEVSNDDIDTIKMTIDYT